MSVQQFDVIVVGGTWYWNRYPGARCDVESISNLLAAALERGAQAVEPEAQAEEAWVEHVNDLAGHTLYPTCNSWYLGANVPGKPRVFMPYLGSPNYVAKCDEVARNGYSGFAFT